MLVPSGPANLGYKSFTSQEPSPTKKKVLAWSDSAITGTGFGVVSRHVLKAIWDTGRYDIHQLAINHHGEFLDENARQQTPWQMQPARLFDPTDPHGMKMFLRTVAQGSYDIVWVLNDIYVTNEISKSMAKLLDDRRTRHLKNPVVIYYYPVDCHVPEDGASFLNLADIPVCYTDHGRAETLKVLPALESRLEQIPHGVDTSVFHPLPENEVLDYKRKLLKTDEDTFLVVNVNRNSTRKQIQYSILAFKEFKKSVPNAKMYVHAAMVDQGGDLRRAVTDLGLSLSKDVIFPMNFSPANPVSPATLNMLYNTGDLFLTTHLGEGWGLTVTEAMAAGTPVVAPDNTCMPQQLGNNSERGYIYPCNDMIWIDNSGFRPKGLISDIVNAMLMVKAHGPKSENPRVKRAVQWAREHDWRLVHDKWIRIFDNASSLRSGQNIAPEVL